MVSPRKKTSVGNSSIKASSNSSVASAKMAPSTKSCESLYSNVSSKGSATILYSRKPKRPTAIHMAQRQPSLIPSSTDVRQRVLSARRLRSKMFQNQVADAQHTIAELAQENRILRTLHKRQDSALAKYESSKADLPKLLHSHSEEVRVWQAKYRTLQTVNKELEQKLKQKDSIILSLTDQNKYYCQLNKDKNLEERQRLTEKLQAMEQRLIEKDNDLKLMARKIQLEAKNFKQQILNEQRKTKEALIKLEKARLELSGYRKLDSMQQLDDKFNNISLRSKTKVDLKPKLKKEVEKPLEKISYSDYVIPDDADFISSHSSKKDNATGRSSDMGGESARNLSKMTSAPSMPASLQALTPHCHSRSHSHSQSQVLSQPLSQQASLPRRKDIGDGDASILSEFKRMSSRPNSEKSKVSKTPQYDDDFETDNLDDDLPNETDYEETEESEVERQDKNSYDFDDIANEGDGEDDIDVVRLSNSKKSARMKEDISSIRKQISNDYKEREAFLDTFCRQATSSAMRAETPKRNSISLSHGSTSSNRKNKLLAALKAIDDKPQD